MKPVYLSLQGLNSFSERAEIDFTKLTQSGIFGIFGDTGSGKSTILDGINFALYGDVGRSKEKTDIINYKCDSVDVKFTFNVLDGGERKNYTVERSIKRKSGTHKAALYEEGPNGESRQIADNASTVKQKVIDIIGVSAEDFRKCIALPQGEFAEFVQSEPRKRVELIERLFNLSKYGEKLKDKLSDLWRSTESEYNTANGEMAAYADVTEEGLKQIESDIKDAKKEFARLDEERKNNVKIYNDASALYGDKIRLTDAEQKIENLYKQSDEMEKLRKNLKLLPDCKRICDEEKFKDEVIKNIEDEKARLSQVEEDIETYQIKFKQADEELKSFNYQNKIAEIADKTARLSASKGKFAELDEIHNKLKQMQYDYEELKKQKEDTQKKLESYQAKLDELKGKLRMIPEVKIESILSSDVKNAIAHSAYNDELIYLCDLRESIKEYKNETKLYDFITAELNQRINYLKEIIYSFTGNKTDINARIAEFQRNFEEREKLSERITNGEKVASDCRGEIKVIDEKISQKQNESKERSQSFQQILAELGSEYGNQPNYEKMQTELADKKTANDNEYERLKTNREQLSLKLSELSEEKKNIIKYIEKRLKEAEDRQAKISRLLNESGIDSVESCRNLLNEFGNYEEASENLKYYDTQITTQKAIIEQFIGINGIRDISEEIVKSAKIRMDESESALSDKNAEIKVFENKFDSLKQKLETKNDISKRLKKITERRNLVGQLESLIKGNNFMKFVADGHLNEISSVASKMLLDLTDGRYFLVYNDGFGVGDNYNGGAQRGVNTLSGGETFLVSLSLALALSGVICARSNKDIEFFFLDEGFGTLDETLIDVVMDALEKLKNSHFTIGIISHVEELKHRIESKIIVNKATESHGSSLTLCC